MECHSRKDSEPHLKSITYVGSNDVLIFSQKYVDFNDNKGIET